MAVSPELVQRHSLPYVAIAARVAQPALGSAVPPLLKEVYAWLAAHSIAPVGPPLARYLVVNYNDRMLDIEVGVPVGTGTVPGDTRIRPGLLRGGTFARAIHCGRYGTLVKTTAAMLAWAKAHDTQWQVEDDGGITTWACRVEHYLVGPPAETNPKAWRTEIAILVAGDSRRPASTS